MSRTKQDLIDRIDQDRDLLIAFFQEFVRCRTPNPPGDTIEAAAFVRRFLDDRELGYEVITPNQAMPNVVASFDRGSPGRHLALNEHIDVFPVEDTVGWTQDPGGAGRRQDLWARVGRHEVRHDSLDFHICLSF